MLWWQTRRGIWQGRTRLRGRNGQPPLPAEPPVGRSKGRTARKPALEGRLLCYLRPIATAARRFWRGLGQTRDPARAAITVLYSSIARVIGPTPPGTGVIAAAFSATAS